MLRKKMVGRGRGNQRGQKEERDEARVKRLGESYPQEIVLQ